MAERLDGSGGEEARREVSTLLGHAHVPMAVRCLGSLLRWATPPVQLRMYDDGSLTGADMELLASELAEPVFVPRRAADERMADLLARHPAARSFRAGNPLGAKLLDVALLGSGEELAYCDADVLFFRRFSGLFDLPAGCGALFMADLQNAYSVRSWQVLAEPRLRLAAHLNSGIITFRRRFFDLDLVEWFLGRPAYRFAPVWVEQTCWALLAQAAGCRLLDPAAVSIPLPGEALRPRQVAYHFVSPVRNLLANLLPPDVPEERWVPLGEAAAPDPTAAAPVRLRSFAAKRLTAAALAMTELRRRVRRWR